MTEAGQSATALVTGTSALVSGATGFLGRHLLGTLHTHGFKVRALVRKNSDMTAIDRQKIEIVNGDVNDLPSLQHAFAGQQWVFHTAGKVSDWGSRADFWRVNAEGTANVIAACRIAGVRRLIHLSSLTVLGLPRSGALVDENTPCVAAPRDAYTCSKLAGETMVRDAHGQAGLETVIVRSGVIWGAGDTTFLPRLAALLQSGRLFYIGHGRNTIGLSHVENLSAGVILAALTPRAAGQIYHFTDGEEITAQQMFHALATVMNVPPPRFSLPYPLVISMATLLEGFARLRRAATPPALTRYSVRMVACDNHYTIAKAQHELGYHPLVTFTQGIASLLTAATQL